MPPAALLRTGIMVFTNPYQEIEDAEKAAALAEKVRKELEDREGGSEANKVSERHWA